MVSNPVEEVPAGGRQARPVDEREGLSHGAAGCAAVEAHDAEARADEGAHRAPTGPPAPQWSTCEKDAPPPVMAMLMAGSCRGRAPVRALVPEEVPVLHEERCRDDIYE